jgi:hypothetical protein
MSESTESFKIRLQDGREFGPAGLELLLQWAREGRIPRDALLVPQDGSPPQPVSWMPELALLLQAPPTVAGDVPAPRHTTSDSALIPTGNPPALIGYYLAVASLLVAPLAIAAFVLGIFGLVRVHRHPESKGIVHAWIGIISILIAPGFWILIIFLLSQIE